MDGAGLERGAGMGLGACVMDTEADGNTFPPGKQLSHKPLTRLQKCDIYLSLPFQTERNQYFPIISKGVLDFLCHILFPHPRGSRGKGAGGHTVREHAVSVAAPRPAPRPFPQRPFRNPTIHPFVPAPVQALFWVWAIQ